MNETSKQQKFNNARVIIVLAEHMSWYSKKQLGDLRTAAPTILESLDVNVIFLQNFAAVVR